ncbi:MAG: chemotaxis protein CheB, partial [Candidatus Tectomicrobia bacterium]|nr:chemotaxis protein CheB [Candidatus Tectomicrobia bacterium]
PVAVAQHRQKGSDDTLAMLLQRFTVLSVGEAEDKEAILPGHIYLAPPDYHLLVEEGHFSLSTEAPVWYARPSIDLLFESAADAYAERVIGVILTGASPDGARGLARIKERGGLAIVQDPATAESRIMPEAAIAATEIDQILPLEAIGPFLAGLCHITPQDPGGVERKSRST